MALHAPVRQVGPFLALAAASLALDAAPQVPWAAGVAGAGLFVAARRAQAATSQRAARRVADHRIVRGHGVPVWREEELVSARARTRRRREVERILRAATADRLPSASPVNRVAIRASASLLRRLAARLVDEFIGALDE